MSKQNISINYTDHDIDRSISYILFLIRSNRTLKYVAQKWDNLPSNHRQEVELKLKCMIECILTNSPPYIDCGDLEFVNPNDISNLCYYIKIAIQNIFRTDDKTEMTLTHRIHNVVNFTDSRLHDQQATHQQQNSCSSQKICQIDNKPKYNQKQKSFLRWR